MKLQIINNDGEVIYFEIEKFDKETKETYITDYIFIEEEFSFILEDRNDIKFIRQFIGKSDEIHLNILFDSEKKYRIYEPEFNFENGLKVKTIIR